ncbi:hypothetical protein FOA43_004569 [Brettanomyces nanus]|uniref:F-box domain-containing protein n=1 Tax=Eeniella nana TaxID=13502 RepID=A0A875S8E8_EENNA|nr:uncharacterized protein FOA43_004569 [Brettanomyces nanus]QPG77163.1 hypothetical protein FOA43_004569 [Brettanomyces nanus]
MFIDLPKEILDKVFGFIDSKDYLNFLLTCTTVYVKCQSSLFQKKALIMYYSGDKNMVRGFKNLEITLKLIEILNRTPELLSDVRVLQLKDKRQVVTRRQPTYSAHKLYRTTKTLNDTIISRISRFDHLRLLKVDVSDSNFLYSILRSLPANLKALIIILNDLNGSTGLMTGHEPSMSIAKTTLKLLKVSYVGKKPLNYRQIKMKNLWHAMDSRQLTENNLNEALRETQSTEIHRSRFSFSRREHNITQLGVSLAQLINTHRDSLFTIDIRGFDANIIFQHPTTKTKLTNLRVLRLSGQSIPKLSWWLPELEKLNRDSRPLLNRLTISREALPPVAVILSNLFQSSQSLHGESDPNYLCRVHFFGHSLQRWVSLDGKAKEFWRNYKYPQN